MKTLLLILIAISARLTIIACPDDLAVGVTDLREHLADVLDQEEDAIAHKAALEGILAKKHAERLRLEAVLAGLEMQLTVRSNGSSPEEESVLGVPDPRELKLIESAAQQMVLLQGAERPLGAAFLAEYDGKVLVFAPGKAVSGEREITVKGLQNQILAISGQVTSPAGVELVGLEAMDPSLPRFELVSSAELPSIGDPVLVLVVGHEVEDVTGVNGKIRGIGPDKWELDADLKPEMNGAPVVALETGKVIGIVTSPVEGVSADWAIGTRHEASRSFAARIDRMSPGEVVSAERFRKEGAFIHQMEEENHLAWLGQMLSKYGDPERTRDGRSGRPSREAQLEEVERLEELRGELVMEAEKYKSAEGIRRIQKWLDDRSRSDAARFGGNSSATSKLSAQSMQNRQLALIFKDMRKGLEARVTDIGDKFSPYHANRYEVARKTRLKGIESLKQAEARLLR